MVPLPLPQTHAQTLTQKHTQRHADTHTQRHTQTHTDTHRHTHRHTDTHTDTDTDTDTDTHASGGGGKIGLCPDEQALPPVSHAREAGDTPLPPKKLRGADQTAGSVPGTALTRVHLDVRCTFNFVFCGKVLEAVALVCTSWYTSGPVEDRRSSALHRVRFRDLRTLWLLRTSSTWTALLKAILSLSSYGTTLPIPSSSFDQDSLCPSSSRIVACTG